MKAVHNCSSVRSGKTTGIPTAQILEARRAFKAGKLSFEALIAFSNNVDAFKLCVRIARGGFNISRVSYRSSANMFLTIEDDSKNDPGELDTILSTSPGITVLRWTVILGGA